MSEKTWERNGYKKRKNVELRPVMAPNHPSSLFGDVFVDGDGRAFSYSNSTVYFGEMKKRNVMVYEDSYVSGDFQNDFKNMTSFLKSYMNNGDAFLNSEKQIEDFSVYFLRKIKEED